MMIAGFLEPEDEEVLYIIEVNNYFRDMWSAHVFKKGFEIMEDDLFEEHVTWSAKKY